MKNFIFLLTLFPFFSCSPVKNENELMYKRTTVSGKVINCDTTKKIDLYILRIGLPPKLINSELDSLGNFSIDFELYMPTDAFIEYRSNFRILLNPGDSLYVEFDGQNQDRPTILNTIMFSGDGRRINQDAAAFQYLFFTSDLYIDRDAETQESRNKASKEYDLKQYQLYLDTLKQKGIQLLEKFETDFSPAKVVKDWAFMTIENVYYDAWSEYPAEHKAANNLTYRTWQVPGNYYDVLLERLPLSADYLQSGFEMNDLINQYYFLYVQKHIENEGFFSNLFMYITKDMEIYGIMKYTSDTLLRQFLLTKSFSNDFEKGEIKRFKKHQRIVNKYIKEPYLKEPLIQLYNQTKARIENPITSTNATLLNLNTSSLTQIMDSILFINKGKIIYLDCWATWCGPCRNEMPNSKTLMNQLDETDVSFVYLCIDSEEKQWKAALDEFRLGGQHHFLTARQSSDLKNIFEIDGVPYYILIDKNGTIVERGSHLRPDFAKEKIEKLLIKF